MKLLQKLEFWILSVPALVVAIGAIAHYGAWRAVWVFPVGYTLTSYVQFSKGMVYELLYGPRVNACRKGKWVRAFAQVMLFPVYNWFVGAALVDCVNLLIVWRYHGAMPLPFVYAIVFAVGFAVATVVRTLRGTCDGGYGDLLIEAERWMLLAAIPVSAIVDLAPGLFALATVAIGVVIVGVQGVVWYKKEHEQFVEFWEAAKKGLPFEQRRDRVWFPRPGVVYEPSERPPAVRGVQIAGRDYREVRRTLTVLSVSPVAFLSAALLVGGAAVLIDRGRGHVLFAAFGAFLLWFIHSGAIADEKWGTWVKTLANAAPHAVCFAGLGAMVAGFGTDDLVLQIATAAFLVGCFEFPTRYVVRATSDRNPDGLRIFATVAAMAVAIWVSSFGEAWYASGLCAAIAAFPLVLVRRFWPVKPLVLPDGGRTAQPGASGGDTATKDRRERKRERQMAAFRRSKRG